MKNYFLNNLSIEINDFETFKFKINEFNFIKAKSSEFEYFYKHESIWGLKIILQLFNSFSNDRSGETTAIVKFIEQLSEHHRHIETVEQFDQDFINHFNAFLGIDFSSTEIPPERTVTDQDSYNEFSDWCYSNIDFRNLWDNKEVLFPNLVLCGEVENQISSIGNSSYFNQIINRLKSLDVYINSWNLGKFSYIEANNNTNLRISPESNPTMIRFGDQRLFSLPGLGSVPCELHIKTGDLRFHFYPDSSTFKIYVAYIGPHLDTVSG